MQGAITIIINKLLLGQTSGWKNTRRERHLTLTSEFGCLVSDQGLEPSKMARSLLLCPWTQVYELVSRAKDFLKLERSLPNGVPNLASNYLVVWSSLSLFPMYKMQTPAKQSLLGPGLQSRGTGQAELSYFLSLGSWQGSAVTLKNSNIKFPKISLWRHWLGMHLPFKFDL